MESSLQYFVSPIMMTYFIIYNQILFSKYLELNSLKIDNSNRITIIKQISI